MRKTVRDRRAVPLLRAVPALIPCSRRRPTSSCPWEPFHAPARPVRHPAAARARPPGAALAAPRRRPRAGPPAGHAAGADRGAGPAALARSVRPGAPLGALAYGPRSEEHTSELQSRGQLVCRLLLEKKYTH